MIFFAENSFSRKDCRINHVEDIAEQLGEGVPVEQMSLYCICGQVLDVGFNLAEENEAQAVNVVSCLSPIGCGKRFELKTSSTDKGQYVRFWVLKNGRADLKLVEKTYPLVVTQTGV
ncbi:hypothetical protein [Limnobacter sp.]|uniref:hypothetical protein n=1 Tax=Limnobacter sp. TaxID=2003368 RepID=UPI0025BBD91C|nr:hypothetical protein [Limnobacter sp.]